MLRIARPFIVLLLVFTLPVQAMAAVAAGVCMAMGHHEAGMAHDHQSGHAPGHAMSHQESQPADGTGETAHCPPCAACCTAGHMAAAPMALVPSLASPELPAAVAQARVPILPEELDRPPLAL